MDSIVDYFIVLFFIISFLSSVFKKKKKKADKAVQDQQRPVMGSKGVDVQKEKVTAQKNTVATKPSFENMLKAMLQVPEPIEEQRSEVDAYYEEALRKSDIMENEKEPLITASEVIHRGNTNEGEPSSYLAAMKKVKMKHSSQKALIIKENLNNNATIKDYIIMNEILGKPIALRE